MKRRTAGFDAYFLHSEVVETHLAVWVAGGNTAANTSVVQNQLLLAESEPANKSLYLEEFIYMF